MEGKPARASPRGKKRKSLLTVKKCFLRPRGRNDILSLRTDPRAWKATGPPLWPLPPSPCLFFILLCSSVYMVGKWIPRSPFITDRATCKDGFDPLPSQLWEEKACLVWLSQTSTVSGPITSGPGHRVGVGITEQGAASREAGSWWPPSGADPSEGLHPQQLPVGPGAGGSQTV